MSIVLLALLFTVVLLAQVRAKKKANQELANKNQVIEKQKQEVEEQRDLAHHQKQKITDSINYAKRIQTAVLPPNNYVKSLLGEHFVLFRPRDIVSGDFYWMAQKEDHLIIAAADCTGHGVPGAFMSMLGVAFLNEIVNKIAINRHIQTFQANEVLNQLRDQIIRSLHQDEDESALKDGMDIALCIIDLENNTLQYAGAHNPLYIVRNGELIHHKADKMPVSWHRNANVPFSNNHIKLNNSDCIYLFSDGFVDQLGGDKGMKFMSKAFKKIVTGNIPEAI
ncbi:MAG: SpoIIE family protein phosphatase [Bacteroidales bacterium]|nr:SpoIIE family protein phosphatase [Bacteroidales bacterium]